MGQTRNIMFYNKCRKFKETAQWNLVRKKKKLEKYTNCPDLEKCSKSMKPPLTKNK